MNSVDLYARAGEWRAVKGATPPPDRPLRLQVPRGSITPAEPGWIKVGGWTISGRPGWAVAEVQASTAPRRVQEIAEYVGAQARVNAESWKVSCNRQPA